MSIYAADTKVPVNNSRNEIESLLKRYGASGFGYMTQGYRSMVVFDAHERRIRLAVNLPSPGDFAVRKHGRGTRRSTPGQMQELAEQAARQRWRALALVIKAKLEAVSAGISTFEDEFMPYILLPNGKTVGEEIRPSIEQAYLTGTMQPLLPA